MALGPPSRPTHATPFVEVTSRPTESEPTVPVKHVRGIARGHVGDERAAREGLSPPSDGKYAMTALISDLGAPGTIAGVGVIETHAVAGEREERRSVGRQMGGEGANCQLASTSASDDGRIKSGEWN